MKKRILAVMLAGIILIPGCGIVDDYHEYVEKRSEDSRFISDGWDYDGSLDYTVITDKETGKKYLFVHYNIGGGLCELDEGENENDETLGN